MLKPLRCLCSRPAQLCSAVISRNFGDGPGQFCVRVINPLQKVFHKCLRRPLHLAEGINNMFIPC